MEKIIFNLTDNELNSMVFNVFNEQEYWIKKIERVRPNNLQGTVVVVEPIDEADSTSIKIVFLYDRLEVEGADVSTIRKLYKAYYKKVVEKIPEYKKEYEESLGEIDDFVNDYKEQIKNHLYDYIFEEAGFLSTKGVKDKINAYKMTGKTPESTKLGRHVEYAYERSNRYNKPNRQIKAGEVYIVDFNPVISTEYGGIRPALIIGQQNEQNYFCVPLSHQESQGMFIGQVKETDAYAVTGQLKIVSPARIFEKTDVIDETIYKAIISEVKAGVKIFASTQDMESVVDLTADNSGGGNSVLDQFTQGFDKRQIFENITNDMPKPIIPPVVNSKKFKSQPQDTLHLDMIEKQLIFPSEEEYVEMLTKKINHLKQTRNLHFISNGKEKSKIGYEFSRDGNNVVILVNKNHNDPSNGYHEMRYEFSITGVKCESDFYPKRKINDTFLKLEFFNFMMAKNDKFYLILFREYVRSFNSSYVRNTQNADEDECAEELAYQVEKMQEILEKSNLVYNGDYEALILSGERAIDYSLVEMLDEKDNENE